MKKNLCLLSVLLLMSFSTLVEAVANPKTTVIDKEEMRISQESITKAMSKLPDKDNRLKTAKTSSDNVEEVVVDLWGTATEIYLFNNSTYDASTNLLTFPGSQEQTSQILTGTDGYDHYVWYSIDGATYTFCGQLSSDGYAEVIPCIVYLNDYDSQWYIMGSATIVLDENNGYNSDFNVSVVNEGISNGLPLSLAFLVKNSSTETTITSSENEFSYIYRGIVAQKWTEETDLPGLGLCNLNSTYAYTALCEDGVTTLGLYYNGSLYVTGINTTANEISLPNKIFINGNIVKINYLGYNNEDMDWTGATNLSKLHIYTERVRTSFNNSKITDLYINSDCYFDLYSGLSNIYLHIPYGYDRDDYEYYGFKRVLVGDEQPEYPIASNSSWVIAGENEGEYYGIRYLYNQYRIVEIFTEKDSVLLPVATPAAGGVYYISGLGADDYYYEGTLCANAPKLKTITIPETYNTVYIYWSHNPITDLHMLGDVPYTCWDLPSSVNVYVAKSYYFNYSNHSDWYGASILPDGWDFEWMTVNVGRKGEFAQTYIEMTDADWGLGTNVKVTGTLNSTDLSNIKNLTNLFKLDLSEAEFTELPSSFLAEKRSLKEVILPSSLTSISSIAFYDCTNLHKVIADGVKTIGNSAFRNCYKLTEFDIADVTDIYSYAFLSCAVFNPVKLSSQLRTLEYGAFAYSGITEVTIPASISVIQSEVFGGCKQLQKVTLPNSIISIEDYAFSGCSNLVEINLPEGITTIAYDAFSDCSNLTEIILPSTLQTLGSNVFDGCTSLLTVKCKAIVPPVTNGEFTYNVDLNHCTLYIAPFAIDAYREAQDWNRFYIMKPLNEPVKNIYINRPMAFNLLSEDNAVLQENPNMTLNYSSNSSVGQLSASGDGTLSAGIFTIRHQFYRRMQSRSDIRTTLVNNAENMRADSVLCSIAFEENYWHFISFQYDVKMEDIFGLNSTDFVIRRYDSANRASGNGSTSNWVQLSAGDVLEAGKGYIIQAANNAYDENGYSYAAVVCFPSRNTVTKNRLFTSNNVIVPLEEYPAEFAHNRSWNLVGNPYPCYYDMHYLMNDFTTPIVLWRGTSYQAYSPIDDDIILRPNEAFFVQRPLDAEEMIFGADGRMHYTEAYNSNATPGSKIAPMYTKTTEVKRSVFNFNIEGCGSDDRTRIVMNEDASMEYEINYDASKFFAENSEGAEIYVNGNVKYDICERPFADGTAVIGARIAKDGEYTISLTGRSIDGWKVILKDVETGATVDLTENEYQFEAKAGTSQSRFVITFKAPGLTSIDNTVSLENNSNVRIINTAGIVVFEGCIDDFKANANAGVYIVINSEKAYKIVIK